MKDTVKERKRIATRLALWAFFFGVAQGMELVCWFGKQDNRTLDGAVDG